MEYTKGKWTVAGRNADGYSIKQVGCSCKIAQVIKDLMYVNQETALANANLIAAAPDMYEALKELVEILGVIVVNSRSIDPGNVVLRPARQALAKAEGK